MAKRKKTYYVRMRKGKRGNKELTKRSTDIKHDPNEKEYLECTTTEEKIEVKQEQIEVTFESCDDKKDDEQSRSDALRQTQVNEKIDAVQQVKIEVTIESCDDVKIDDDESRSYTLRQIPDNEELWVVRRQLCRGCHSDGAFWSLQTTTEGDTYGDLLQTYFNIQLCPVPEEEHALSAICGLCALRLREARAFSAQAHAAEERFTRLYKQNRVRALLNEAVIKKDVPKIKNEVDDFITADDVEPDTANENLDHPETSMDALAPTINKNKQTQESPSKPASKQLFLLSPSDYERIGKLIKCTRCDKQYYSRSGILRHVKNVHFKPQKYTCPHCDKAFKDLSDFKRHKRLDHSKKNKKVYKISPSDFERVGNSYKCTRCEKQVRDYSQVRYHVMYTHLKLPRYTCSHCDETFHGLAPFTKHKLEEHSIDDRIKCNACDWSTYLSKSVLMKHKNEFHMLGVKKTCPDCDYFCFSQKAIKRHAVKHSTVKEHHCKYCKKSFLRKSNLDSHERIHTGDKRKVCNVCGQAFVQRASLTYHMAKHHPEIRF